MRSIRMLSAALLATAGLIVVGVTTEAANASSKDLVAQYNARVIGGETFTLSGKLATPVARTVKLQYRNQTDDPWITKSTKTSSANGFFSFSLTTGKTRYYRYYAPPSGEYAKISGNSKKVYKVSQTVKVFEVSDARQCKFLWDDSNFTDMTVVAKFYPARPGREVKFVTEKYGTLTGTQDSSGIESKVIHPGTVRQSSTVQGHTSAANGAPAKYTSTKTTSLTTCQIIFEP